MLGNHEEFGKISIDNNCLGLDMMYLFSSMIIAFPSKIKYTKKLTYILIGSLIIHIVNIIRIVCLILTLIYIPQYIKINHHIIFNLIICGIIFLMWVRWIAKVNK
jgi:exosortase family protein XrtF